MSTFGYVVALDLHDQPAVLVGGGREAVTRLDALLAAGATVTVITPAPSPPLVDGVAAAAGRATLLQRDWQSGDLAGARIAIVTREDASTDVQALWTESRERHVTTSVLDDLDHTDFAQPALVRRGDLRIAISTGGSAPALARRYREELESLLGPEHGDVVAAAATAREVVGPRPVAFDEWAARWALAVGDVHGLADMVRTHGRQAVVDHVVTTLLTATAPAHSPPHPGHEGSRMTIDVLRTAGLGLQGAHPGWVHLVGAGPGDPGLLTLRGAALLATADIVAIDRLADPRLLQLVPTTAEIIRVGKNPDRSCRERTWTQREITQLVVTAAGEGKAVVRCKGGDPFVFGRGGEEALACRAAGIPFEIVSGVSSAIAGPAAAAIPVTHRGLATGVAFITGHEDPTKSASQIDWDALARFHGTLVFLMGVRNAPDICARLVANGRDATTPAAAIQWATTPRQRVVHSNLADLPADLDRHGIGSPATIVVGDVVGVGALLQDGLVTTSDRATTSSHDARTPHGGAHAAGLETGPHTSMPGTSIPHAPSPAQIVATAPTASPASTKVAS